MPDLIIFEMRPVTFVVKNFKGFCKINTMKYMKYTKNPKNPPVKKKRKKDYFRLISLFKEERLCNVTGVGFGASHGDGFGYNYRISNTAFFFLYVTLTPTILS